MILKQVYDAYLDALDRARQAHPLGEFQGVWYINETQGILILDEVLKVVTNEPQLEIKNTRATLGDAAALKKLTLCGAPIEQVGEGPSTCVVKLTGTKAQE